MRPKCLQQLGRRGRVPWPRPNRKKVRDWAASAQRRGSNVDLAARAEAQAETTESRCGGCLCCCGPRPDVLVEHEAQREARIAAHRGVLPGLEAGDA